MPCERLNSDNKKNNFQIRRSGKMEARGSEDGRTKEQRVYVNSAGKQRKREKMKR